MILEFFAVLMLVGMIGLTITFLVKVWMDGLLKPGDVPDPERARAVELAMQELDEMDYIVGVGPMPTHVAVKLKADQERTQRKKEAEFRQGLQRTLEKGTSLEKGRRIEPLDISVASFNPPVAVMPYVEYDEHGVALNGRWVSLDGPYKKKTWVRVI